MAQQMNNQLLSWRQQQQQQRRHRIPRALGDYYHLTRKQDHHQHQDADAIAQVEENVKLWLATAADTAAIQQYKKGQGQLRVQVPDMHQQPHHTEQQLHHQQQQQETDELVVHDRLPGSLLSELHQLLGPAYTTGSSSSSTKQQSILAFSESRSGFLRKQDSNGMRCRLQDGTPVTVSLNYSFNGPGSIKSHQMTINTALSLVKFPGTCEIIIEDEDDRVLFRIQVRVLRVVVLRADNPTVGWQQQQQQQHEQYWKWQERFQKHQGCVALYMFPGTVLQKYEGVELPLLLPLDGNIPLLMKTPQPALPPAAAAAWHPLTATPAAAAEPTNYSQAVGAGPCAPAAMGTATAMQQLELARVGSMNEAHAETQAAAAAATAAAAAPACHASPSWLDEFHPVDDDAIENIVDQELSALQPAGTMLLNRSNAAAPVTATSAAAAALQFGISSSAAVSTDALGVLLQQQQQQRIGAATNSSPGTATAAILAGCRIIDSPDADLAAAGDLAAAATDLAAAGCSSDLELAMADLQAWQQLLNPDTLSSIGETAAAAAAAAASYDTMPTITGTRQLLDVLQGDWHTEAAAAAAAAEQQAQASMGPSLATAAAAATQAHGSSPTAGLSAGPSHGITAAAAIAYQTPAAYDHRQITEPEASDTNMSEELLPEIEPVDCRQLRGLQQNARILNFRLLDVFAGCYGINSIAALQQMWPAVLQHNNAVAGFAECMPGRGNGLLTSYSPLHNVTSPAAAAAAAADLDCRGAAPGCCIDLSSLTDHYGRNALHILVGNIRGWRYERCPTFDADMRQQLMSTLRQASSSGSGSGSGSGIGSGSAFTRRGYSPLLRRTNCRGVTPWHTACHFCLPEVLNVLLTDSTFKLTDMLKVTSEGHRLFYHVIARQAKKLQDKTQHRDALKASLTVLYFKLERWVHSKATPQELQGERKKMNPAPGSELDTAFKAAESRAETAAAAVGSKRHRHTAASSSSSSAGCLPQPLCPIVLWLLQTRYIFHLHNPTYDVELLESVVQDLFGFTISNSKSRQQAAAVSV